jgi:ADP-ribose pyrophosphatase YjhB (NUDIX family)
MVNFTMGIIFSPDLKDVYLLRKDHPEWQDGKLNGVGGHLQAGENYADAMSRESKEESGYAGKFIVLGSVRGEETESNSAFQCEVFYSVMGAKDKEPHTIEKEKIEKHPIADLLKLIPEMVPHLPTLILSALAHHEAKNKFSVSFNY